jgi:FkbM family methyltransferase
MQYSQSVVRLGSYLSLLCLIGTLFYFFWQRQPEILVNIPSPTIACPQDDYAMELTYMNSRSFCLYLLRDDIVSTSIVKTKSWMPHQTTFINVLLSESLSKPAVFLDIGANIGWFTMVMSALNHRVIAIEAMKTNTQLLQSSLAASKLQKSVRLHHHGISSVRGKCILYSDNLNVGDGHMTCGISADANLSAVLPPNYSIREVIETKSLDALVQEPINVMKIDVEGSELQVVMSGMQLFDRYGVKHIITEFTPNMMRSKSGDPYHYLMFFFLRGYQIRAVNSTMPDLYQQKEWDKMPTFETEQELRDLSNRKTDMELWLTRQHKNDQE